MVYPMLLLVVTSGLRQTTPSRLAHINPGAREFNAFLDIEREVGRYLSHVRVSWLGSPVQALERSDRLPKHSSYGSRVGILA